MMTRSEKTTRAKEKTDNPKKRKADNAEMKKKKASFADAFNDSLNTASK